MFFEAKFESLLGDVGALIVVNSALHPIKYFPGKLDRRHSERECVKCMHQISDVDGHHRVTTITKTGFIQIAARDSKYTRSQNVVLAV